MKNIKSKILNIILIIVFSIPMFVTSEMIAEQILESFKPLWFTIFFVSYGGTMFNLMLLLNLKYIGKRFTMQQFK